MVENRGTERRGAMTKVAILRCRQVVNGRILAGGVLAVVTAFAIRGNALVVKHATGEIVGVMTDATILGGRYMVSGFANRDCAVMATGAIAGDAFVTERRGNKRRGRMTNVTILGGGNMIDRGILAGRRHAVMTTFTTPGNTFVIENRG